MSPDRLAEIERILCSNATWWRDHAVDLVAEVRRLIAVAVDIETQRSTIARQAIEQELKLETRIVRLEAGLREALSHIDEITPGPTKGVGSCTICDRLRALSSSAPHDSPCASPED